jgi:ABC-type molybdate transport system ATPase subunit
MSMLLLKEEYSKNNVRLRVLASMDNQIIQIIEELKRVLSRLDIRALNESTESNRVTILLADRKECLIVEIKDDTKDNVYEAVGLSIYSNTKSIVLSYLAIFETIWNQGQPHI